MPILSVFISLGVSFSMRVVAEMMGAKSDLGWYLPWAAPAAA
jgi:ABC-type nitrate/sulfonate/bicarbonate transport system permease component